MSEITKDTLIPKELGNVIIREFEKLMDKDTPVREAVREATKIATNRWRRQNADKSGG